MQIIGIPALCQHQSATVAPSVMALGEPETPWVSGREGSKDRWGLPKRWRPMAMLALHEVVLHGYGNLFNAKTNNKPLYMANISVSLSTSISGTPNRLSRLPEGHTPRSQHVA
jgi:hypothetical protein